MIRPKLLFGWILLTGASLTACSKEARSDAAGTEAFSTNASRPEDQFGKEFGKAFRAPPNSEPANVSDDDVVPISLTAEPVQLE